MNPTIGRKQCIEFGLVLTLATLVISLVRNEMTRINLAVAIVLVTIILPGAFYPFAWVWFKLAKAMSVIGPVVMLTLVFFLVVTPMGALRKLLGKDTMRRKDFKKGNQSVMQTREHTYVAEDFLHLF